MRPLPLMHHRLSDSLCLKAIYPHGEADKAVALLPLDSHLMILELCRVQRTGSLGQMPVICSIQTRAEVMDAPGRSRGRLN